MKNTLILFLVTILILSFNSFEKETYTALVDESIVEWAGSRTGKTHNGSLKIKEGSLDLENNVLVSGEFILNMTTIKVLDIKEGSNMNAKLVDHLNSKDFFNTTEFPEGKYVITKSEKQGDKVAITGNLTIKNITNEVIFLAVLENTDDMLILKSDEFKIDRTKWGVEFRSGKFFDNLKDKLIYDDIVLSVKVKAKK